jgi:hypothetical protein
MQLNLGEGLSLRRALGCLVKWKSCAASVLRFRHMGATARHTADEPLAEHERGQDSGDDQQNFSGWESDHLSCLCLETFTAGQLSKVLAKKKGAKYKDIGGEL